MVQMSDPFFASFADGSGFARSRRSPLRDLRAIARNPLSALPSETFDQRLTVSRLFGRTRIHLTDPALIHEAFVTNADALAKTELNQRVLGPALGRGLLTADGAHWRFQRRALSPAFGHGRLLALLPAMIGVAEATRDRWLATARTGGQVDLGLEMMRTTFAIIVDTMLSGPGEIDAGRVERAIADYLAPTPWLFALGIAGAPDWVPFPGRRRFAQASRTLRETVAAMVAERRLRQGGSEDLVAMLLAARDPDTGHGMGDAEIVDNILTFVAAGHETTANALTWTLLLLAEAPDEGDRVLRELADVVGDGPVLAGHVERLRYTRQIVSEALRLYPPAPMIARTVTRAFALGGLPVPAGITLIVPIYALHRNNRICSDPAAFKPARFSAGGTVARHRYAFMPFGLGPRVCIGSGFAMLEAVAILAVLLKAVKVAAGRGIPDATMRVTLRPSQPVRVSLSARTGGATQARDRWNLTSA